MISYQNSAISDPTEYWGKPNIVGIVEIMIIIMKLIEGCIIVGLGEIMIMIMKLIEGRFYSEN